MNRLKQRTSDLDMMQVLVDDKEIIFMIDSGASCNIINDVTAKLLKLNITPFRRSLKVAGGATIQALGFCCRLNSQ